MANAHVLSLKKVLKVRGSINVYNVGTGKGASVLECYNCFEEVSKQKLSYQFGPRREGDVPENIFR